MTTTKDIKREVVFDKIVKIVGIQEQHLKILAPSLLQYIDVHYYTKIFKYENYSYEISGIIICIL